MEKSRRHKWDHLTDTCIICGIKKRIRPLRTKYTMIAKGKITEYLVGDEWVAMLPPCNVLS